MLELEEMENRHCSFPQIFLDFLIFQFCFFKRKTKCLVKLIEKTQYPTLIPSNNAKNLTELQAHGGVVAIKVISHKDLVDLLSFIPLR